MKILTRCEAETVSAGERYAATLEKGDVVLLYGEMGAGKTAFVKGVAKGLDIKDEVVSPTYSYMNDYGGRLYHYDCYRLSSGEDAEALGLTDYFYSGGICIVEWPDNISDVLPRSAKRVRIDKISDCEREIEL